MPPDGARLEGAPDGARLEGAPDGAGPAPPPAGAGPAALSAGAGSVAFSAGAGPAGPPLALTGFLPAWDIERRRADLSPVAAWAVEQIRRFGHPVEGLDALHRHLDAEGARALARRLTAASVTGELRRRLVRAILEAIPELPAERVSAQTQAHFRILVPGDAVAAVPPHTDYGFGHGLDERNLWLSLTDARGSAALHVLPLRESLAWAARAGTLYGVFEDAPDLPPVPTRAGELLLFTPLHLHRARPPVDACRVSIDLRLLPTPARPADLSFCPLRSHP